MLFKESAAQLINKDAFEQRRQQFMSKMDDGIAIFTSAKVATRNNDIDYKYRQESNFYYLTGFEEPESAILLIPGAEHEFIMFVRKRNPIHEAWTGKLYGIEGAMKIFGADTAFSIDKFEKILFAYLQDKAKVYCGKNDKQLNNKLLSMMEQPFGAPPKQLIDPLPFVHKMRLIKGAEEIELMKRSIDITCDAHIELMKAAELGMFEYEMEAIIEYIYRKNGCQRAGFPSIVGSGPNATVLHYDANNQQIKSGDVIVIDIGAEYGYYSADITRTIPVNGKYSKEQKEIYQIVLKAQKEGINMMKPGIGLREVERKIADVIKRGLFRLGLITNTNSEWQYRLWFPHGSCHWLGIDVHDVGGYRGTDRLLGHILEKNMVTTIEPGIYIRENILDYLLKEQMPFGEGVQKHEIVTFVDKVRPVVKKYINIGVRIEDDILITENGNEVLSAKAPKEIKEIEKLMKESSYLNK